MAAHCCPACSRRRPAGRSPICGTNAAGSGARSIMARHGYGSGAYRYFAYPLPEPDRRAPGRALSAARRDRQSLGGAGSATASASPPIMPTFSRVATPPARPGRRRLLLRYEAGDWNALHQDVYGEQLFPLQAAILLSRPGEDFAGGEFVLAEQRPRMQSRPEVVPLAQGDAVVFPVRERPVEGRRGWHRVTHAARRQPASAPAFASPSASSSTTPPDRLQRRSRRRRSLS